MARRVLPSGGQNGVEHDCLGPLSPLPMCRVSGSQFILLPCAVLLHDSLSSSRVCSRRRTRADASLPAERKRRLPCEAGTYCKISRLRIELIECVQRPQTLKHAIDRKPVECQVEHLSEREENQSI